MSVVVPARNEADTITGVVHACTELAGALVDEVVVVDAGSDDRTAELAVAAGARVHNAAQVLAELGPSQGKGDALWRSLEVTSGDLLVFLDADVRNPSPRYVTGLLGPLLTAPDVSFVKGFYDRPLHTAQAVQPGGGGRVTELCARPLLNLLWPTLAGLVQPLAGESAGRRSLLERLPFFTGYGVELGLLIDVLAAAGLHAIAQVDLAERIHRNQPLDELSRMAFAIMQVALHRLADTDLVRLDAELPTGYLQFERDELGDVAPRSSDVAVVERPAHVRCRRR